MAKQSDLKKGFFLYKDYIDHVRLMSDEDAGKLLKAILLYENGISIGELDGVAGMAFSFIKAQLDRDANKYDEICRRNRENGSKGGRPRKTPEPVRNTDNLETDENPKEPKKPTAFSAEDADGEPEGKPDAVNAKRQQKKEAQELFERLWKLYPNKKGKNAVSDKRKLEILAVGEDAMKTAISRYCEELEKDDWRNPQYGSTFFNGSYVDYLDGNYTPGEPKKKTGTNRFNNFSQRQYDFDALERMLTNH